MSQAVATGLDPGILAVMRLAHRRSARIGIRLHAPGQARTLVVFLGLALPGWMLGPWAGCGPRQGNGNLTQTSPRPGTPLRPLPAKDARTLAGRFSGRSQVCFPAVFKESLDKDMEPLDRADQARRRRAVEALGRELDACLRGHGYGGRALASATSVRRWLAEKTCEGFARQTFGSRECFMLQLVLEEAGFPLSLPRHAPPRGKTTRPRHTGPAPVPADGFYRASHILIFYVGAQRAPTTVTRSKADALRLASSLTAQARAPKADFAALAKRFSECSSAARGGDLGRFQPHVMVPAFAAALKDLHPGEIGGPVETPFGYHVILRH